MSHRNFSFVRKCCLFCSVLLLTNACSFSNKPPEFENTKLTRYADQTGDFTYAFHFDFLNKMRKPLLIDHISVLDKDNNKLTNAFIEYAKKHHSHVEFFTHDFTLAGGDAKEFIASFPEQFAPVFHGTPLETATIDLQKAPIEVQQETRTLQPSEQFRNSRYLFKSNKRHDQLTLQVTYKLQGKSFAVEQNFTAKEEETVLGRKD